MFAIDVTRHCQHHSNMHLILQSAYQLPYYTTLVRPMTGYRTIGDAHAKGVPIAWLLICVCYSCLSSYVVLASYLMHVQVINFTSPLHYAG